MIRWGILGAGSIAHRFARSVACVAGSELVAISCRSRGKADAFADEFGVASAHVHVGHEGLLLDPGVDAVYLALPHGLHLEWSRRAMRAGKAVLCEKPAALSADETRAIAAASRETGALFMEAMKTRFVPAYRRVRDLVDAGAVGEVVGVEASLCNDLSGGVRKDSYLLDPRQGGVLLDCGIYCAGWLEDFLPGEPVPVSVDGIVDDGGIDRYVDARLRIGGRDATLECACDRRRPRRARIVGTDGVVAVDELHRPESFSLVDGRTGVREDFEAPYDIDDFSGEISHFAHLLEEGRVESDVMSLDDSVRCAAILDAVRSGLPRQHHPGTPPTSS